MKELPPPRVIRETPHWCSSCDGTGWRNCRDNEGDWVERCGCVDGILWDEEELPAPVAAPPRTGDDAEIAAELDEIAAAVRVLENCYYPLIKSVDWGIQFRASERVKALATRLRDSRG